MDRVYIDGIYTDTTTLGGMYKTDHYTVGAPHFINDEKLKQAKKLWEKEKFDKEIIAPLVYIVPLQLISYYITLEKGHDPDKPKNLAKCVTVE